jgi:hypothetical protein
MWCHEHGHLANKYGILLHGQRNVETINSKRIEPYEEMERAPL